MTLRIEPVCGIPVAWSGDRSATIGEMTAAISELMARIAELEAELVPLKSGERVLIPTSIRHAQAMHLVADRYLKDNARDERDHHGE